MTEPGTSNFEEVTTTDEGYGTSGRISIGSYFSGQYEEILLQLEVIEEHLCKQKVISASDWEYFVNQFKSLQDTELELLIPVTQRYLGCESKELQQTMVSEHQQTRRWMNELLTESVLSIRINRCRQLSRFIVCYLLKMQGGLYQIIDGLGLEFSLD